MLTPLASYVGLVAMLAVAWDILNGTSNVSLVALLVTNTFLILMGITVGAHRLFCHRSFKTSALWHGLLGYLATVACYGSTVQWAGMHMSHHIHSDTARDPHYTGWRYLFWKKNKPTEFHKKTIIHLYRNPLHRFLHNYYLVIVFGTALVLYLINPWVLVYGYLAPLGWLHFVGSAHQVFAHNTQGPQDQPLMELVLFTGGEWLHGHHHRRARDPRFGKWDLGYQFIRVIRT